jgi:ABC-type transporter Mla maintaining outer membrane lipid asymmetry ATPase subunit MlaF
MAAPSAENPGNVPALEMRDVTVTSLRDASQVILEGVNWTVAAGDFWAVAGLLRSGKSDLMALAAGITRPARGTCKLLGREIATGFEAETLALRLRVGLVFDGGQLLHHLTLAENIALPLRYHFDDGGPTIDQRIQALVELTGLEPWAGSHPADVTRNWQQRFGLARALALKPEVLLLDNPLTGLDPRDAAWWLEIVEALAAGHPIVDGKPLTLVVTGDDLRPWQNRARQFALLKDRQFIPLGARTDLAGHAESLLQDLLPTPVMRET